MYRSHITKTELTDIARKTFNGPISIVDQPDKIASAIHYLSRQEVLGFDTESKPSFRKGVTNKVALVQLATAERAFLFRINKISIPHGLVDILIDKSIKKIGVAIHDDLKLIRQIRNHEAASFIDLQKYAKAFGIESMSLQKLSAIVLNFTVSKKQQLSNWEADKLTEKQQRYAATDAWVPYLIYKKLSTY